MMEIVVVRGDDGVVRLFIDRNRNCKVYQPRGKKLKSLRKLVSRHRGKVEPFFTRDYVGFKLVADK